MNILTEYLDEMVEPTIEDFRQNSASLRHCYLACAATFHAADRAAKMARVRSASIREKWGRRSRDFKLIDVVANDFKHIREENRSGVPTINVRPRALLGSMGFNTAMLGEFDRAYSLERIADALEKALMFIRSEAQKAARS